MTLTLLYIKSIMMKNNQFIARIQKERAITSYIQILGPLSLENYFYATLDTPLIFVDGGARHLPSFNEHNFKLIVGDGDSFSGKIDIKENPQKDFSDLTIALNVAGKYALSLFLDGFFPSLSSELRIDHYLANLGECYQWSKKYQGMIQLSNELIMLPKGYHCVPIVGIFSIFALESNALTLTGNCKYKIPKPILIKAFSSLGLSNIGYGVINITCSMPILISLQRDKF